jgi:hypothetical protein
VATLQHDKTTEAKSTHRILSIFEALDDAAKQELADLAQQLITEQATAWP